jgi:hypothetical protein
VGGIRPYLLKGGIAPFDGLVTGTVHSFKILQDSHYNYCALSIFQDGFFNYAINNSKGTKMPIVAKDDLLEYPLPYNKEIVEEFNTAYDFKEKIVELIQEIQNLESLKSWLHPLLMNEQVKVG